MADGTSTEVPENLLSPGLVTLSLISRHSQNAGIVPEMRRCVVQEAGACYGVSWAGAPEEGASAGCENLRSEGGPAELLLEESCLGHA